jgi:hypothetical protein
MSLTINLGLVPHRGHLKFSGTRFEQMSKDAYLVTMWCIEPFRAGSLFPPAVLAAMPVDTPVEVDSKDFEEWVQKKLVPDDLLVVTELVGK